MSSASAKELYEPFQSLRQLGMGGVYVFEEHDAGSFMQNPAYTCYTSGLNWTIFDIQIALGDLNAYVELTEETGSLPDPGSLEGLSPYYGKNLWFRAGGYSAFTLPCFGFAGFYTGLTGFQLHNPAYPQLNTYFQQDYGVNIGGAIPLSPFLSLGLAVKRVDRRGGPHVFGPDMLADLSGDGAVEELVASIENEGVGYGLDMGLVSRFDAIPFNPTVSLGWRDVGSMSFNKTKGDDAPNRQKDNLVFGAGINGSVPLLGFAAGFEYRHITDNDEQIGKKLHLGAEVSIAFLDVRAGFYQGYTTMGLGLNLWVLRLDAAKYTVEQGVYPGQSPQERAHIGLMLDLEFDPNFNLVDAGGKKRRLKQRR